MWTADMMKLIVTFLSFANVSKKQCYMQLFLWVVEFFLLLLTPVTLMLLFFMPVSCPQLNIPSGACESGVILLWSWMPLFIGPLGQSSLNTPWQAVSFICVHLLVISVLSLLSLS